VALRYNRAVPPLHFRAPGRALRLVELVARVVPDAARAALASAIRGGGLRVDGRAARDPEAIVAAGARIEGTLPFTPPKLAAEDAAASGWLALVPAPPWPSGRFEAETGGGEPLIWRTRASRDGIALLAIDPWRGGTDALRRRLAVSGCAILGDAQEGGIALAGGLRLREAGPEPEPDATLPPGLAFPDEPVFPGEREDGERAALRVSDATLRAVGRGHPWILTDTETGDAGRYRAGTLVQLEAASVLAARAAQADERRGRARRGAGRDERAAPAAPGLVLARIEGPGPLAARVWEPRLLPGQRPRSVEARVADALARRRALLAGGATDCLRLVHGEADGLPGLAIDRVGPLLRVLVSGRCCEPVLERVVDAVAAALRPFLGADPPIVRVLHLRERPPGRFACVSLLRGALPPDALDAEGRVTVSERGLRFLADPGLGAPEQPSAAYGFFPDQRENRARLAAVAAGGRWLNLFAHTGAFSAALLAAGAASVTSVDLSGAYLRWLESNLACNGLADARHVSHRGDGRRFFERLAPDERFDGIVLDPPTAAAAGRRFWSVRRDLPALVEAALARLAPGGWLLVTRNDRSGRGRLADLVREAAVRSACPVGALDDAPPGEDFPSLRGFPEGDPFEGVLFRRAARAGVSAERVGAGPERARRPRRR